jgi:hypothetical protein
LTFFSSFSANNPALKSCIIGLHKLQLFLVSNAFKFL